MNIKYFLFAILAIFITNCTSIEAPEVVDSHHEEVKIQITAYSNEFELFAEADPFIVGKTSSILSHFSHLPEFTALENGSMTIRLIVNGKEASHTLDKPTRKGIYKFEIIPETKGTGQLLFDIMTDKGKFQVKALDVGVFSNEHDAFHAAEDIVVSTTNATVFTKEQSWKVDFATEFPKLEAFGQVLKTTAQVQSAQGDEILISAKTNGIVQLLVENVIDGKSVSKGQILLSISGSGLSNNNSSVRFLEAKNNYQKTKSDYERLADLGNDKIVSEKEVLHAKNLYDNAKVNYDNLNKNFNISGQNVKSSMKGYVKQLFVQNGQYIEAGQPLVLISQNKTLLLKAEVQQKYKSILSTINSANIRALNDSRTYPLDHFNGKILPYGKNTNNDNYLIPINLQIDNKGDFVSGEFVELYLKTLTNNQAVTIPNSSLLEDQGVYFVFVQITPELFEKREVKIGVTDGSRTEILKGITQQDRIVTVGAILIKLAQATGTLDAHSGHNH